MSQQTEAATLLAFVLAYEKLNEETRAAAQEVWARVVAGLSQKEIHEAEVRGRGLTLATIIPHLLHTLNHPSIQSRS